MSNKYGVALVRHNNRRGPRREIEELLKEIHRLMMNSSEWPLDPREVVFRNLSPRWLPDAPPYGFDIRNLYLSQLGGKRQLHSQEERFVSLLQRLLDSTQDVKEFRHALAMLFEKIVIEDKRAQRGSDVIHCATLSIDGHTFTFRDRVNKEHREVDFGVDRLDESDLLEVGECTLKYQSFAGEKSGQIEFLGKLMEEVRQKVSPSTGLRVELIAATARVRWLDEISEFELRDFRASATKVVARSYFPSCEEILC